MKKLNYLFLIAIPAFMFSCSDRSGTNKANDRDVNDDNREMKRDNNRGSERDTMRLEESSFSLVPGSFFQDNDQEFVKEAASGGLMEVEAGRFAELSAKNSRVKMFAAMIVKEHTSMYDELKSLAGSKNIEIPAEMTTNHKNKLENLQKENGENFDKAFMKEMVDAHQKDVDLFTKQAGNGKVSELKAFASKSIENLQLHLDSAKAIQQDLGKLSL